MSHPTAPSKFTFTAWFSAIINSIGTVIAAIGLLFMYLKHKLDRANYHRDLFEERYEIFCDVDNILKLSFQDIDDNDNKITCKELRKKLNSIWRKSYFLFCKDTYQFIDKFRNAVIEKSHHSSPEKVV